MNKNEIVEPDNEQGKFETALHLLQEKLTHFHCPICHAEEGITFFDEPYFTMHFDWDKHDDKPWGIESNGYGKACVLGVCNNCGYSMLFNTGFLTIPFKKLTITNETIHVKKVIELIEKRKKSGNASK